MKHVLVLTIVALTSLVGCAHPPTAAPVVPHPTTVQRLGYMGPAGTCWLEPADDGQDGDTDWYCN